VLIPLASAVLLRGTRHPLAGAAVAAVAAGLNLWSGRVPFLFGSVFGLLALIALRNRKLVPTLACSVIGIVASPVIGAFMAVGLAGVFLSRPAYRRLALWTGLSIAAALGAVALTFGTPGPEPFGNTLLVELLGALLLLQLARPPVWLRTTIWVSIIAALALATFPNALGSNFARLVWFCLPVAVVALSAFRVWLLLLLVAPLLVAGGNGTVVDLRNAVKPVSTVAYYRPLAAELDTLADLTNYRVEVVNHGAHAAYDALLNHATLARGWETQDDIALNGAIQGKTLAPTTYKVWLDNNAVGYVALPSTTVSDYAEYELVGHRRPDYLRLIWQSTDWKLFRVLNPTPIVAAPAQVVTTSQSRLVVDIPCACTVGVRVRWSRFLQATGPSTNLPAAIANDGYGWTKLTTTLPGTYQIEGALGGLLH
jgi:hypothetical protein